MEGEIALHVCTGVALCLFTIFSVVCNVGVILVISRTPSLRKKENVFVVSLAVSDLIQGLLGIPLDGAHMALGYWPFGQAVHCVFVHVIYVSSTSSILAICAVSMSRYILIKEPFKYVRLMTRARVVLSLVTVWCAPLLLLCFLYAVYGVLNPPDQDEVCFFTISDSGAFAYSALTFYMPSLVMIFIYCRLYLFSRLHLANISKLVPDNGSQHHHKAVLTIGFIMGAYLFCWLPFFLLTSIYQLVFQEMPSVLYNTCLCLGYLNSIVNPIVYSLTNREFRESLHNIALRRDWCRAFNQTRTV